MDKNAIRAKIDHARRIASALDLVYVMVLDDDYFYKGEYTLNRAIAHCANSCKITANELTKAWNEVTAEPPAFQRGKRIRITGWHPDSSDESNDHPQTHFEWSLTSIGDGKGKFEYLGGDIYQARRDLTKDEWNQILNAASKVRLSIYPI